MKAIKITAVLKTVFICLKCVWSVSFSIPNDRLVIVLVIPPAF